MWIDLLTVDAHVHNLIFLCSSHLPPYVHLDSNVCATCLNTYVIVTLVRLNLIDGFSRLTLQSQIGRTVHSFIQFQ